VSSEDGGAEGRPPRKALRPSGNAKQGYRKDGKPVGKPLAGRPERAPANSTASLLRKPEQLMSAGQNGLIGLSAMTGHNMTSDQHVMKGPRVMSGQSVMIGMPIKTARHSLKKVANPHLP
jgi:hypothetical protein